MDQLTEQQRRRIYQEEKKKDEANRGRATNRRSVGCLVAVGLVLLLIALVPVLGRSGAFGGLLSRSDDEAPTVTPALTRVPAPSGGCPDVLRGRRVARRARGGARHVPD